MFPLERGPRRVQHVQVPQPLKLGVVLGPLAGPQLRQSAKGTEPHIGSYAQQNEARWLQALRAPVAFAREGSAADGHFALDARQRVRERP